jgi:CRISPR-associated protein Csy3
MSVKDFPSVLSIQRGTVITDGIMYEVIPGKNAKKVRVVRHGILGVLPEKEGNSVNNPQRTESAKTSYEATALEVRYSYRTIPAKSLLFDCSAQSYRNTMEEFIDRFFKRGNKEFDEVCRRYARNILNGRWLWRNRMLGAFSVTAKSGNLTFSSEGSTLNGFDNYTEDEISLAENVIAKGLLPLNTDTPVLDVVGRVDFGFTGAVEVFPSQNMVTGKPKGFARSLYKVNIPTRQEMFQIASTARADGEGANEFMADQIDMGIAALRDQKIGNAIRTIDTWYETGDSVRPIAIEPNGASMDTNEIHRGGKGKFGNDSKSLLKRIDEIEPKEEFNPDAAFLIALMIRGGVFSEKAEK